MQNLAFLIALHSVEGLGSVRLGKMIAYFEDPKKAWFASKNEIISLQIPKFAAEKLESKRKELDPESYFEKITNSGIKVLTIFEDKYPERLKSIYDPPIILYYKGEIIADDGVSVGVVGTRKVTGYGKTVTEQLCREIAQAKVTIISGLARGVDTIAHKAAIAEKGRTIAVLGGGLDKIFPPENTELARLIVSGYGAMVSEFPPDYPHLAGNFPARNRIIAGLSQGVLVTEAAVDSGSLITARLAIDEGREVYAVPGPITSSVSEGPSHLIRNGAKLILSAKDILEDFGFGKNINGKQKKELELNLSENEKEVLSSLENEQKHIDEICRELKKSSADISGVLIKLEISGLLRNLGGGVYTKG